MEDVLRGVGNVKQRILIVDDTESVSYLMHEMLVSFGYEAEVALAVDKAFALFVPGKYDLVVTDYLMPVMNGVELAAALKQQAPGQRVLLITGSTFPPTNSAARQLPVDGMLQKPFSVDEFRETVKKVLVAQPILLSAPAVRQPRPLRA